MGKTDTGRHPRRAEPAQPGCGGVFDSNSNWPTEAGDWPHSPAAKGTRTRPLEYLTCIRAKRRDSLLAGARRRAGRASSEASPQTPE